MDILSSRESAVIIEENKLFCFYGEALNACKQERLISCRIEGASQLVKGSQTVISLSKL